MIDYTSGHGALAKLGRESSALYSSANEPWPHLVIDDFFEPRIARSKCEGRPLQLIDQSVMQKFLDRKTDHKQVRLLPESWDSKPRSWSILKFWRFHHIPRKAYGDLRALGGSFLLWRRIAQDTPGVFSKFTRIFNHWRRYELARRLNLLLISTRIGTLRIRRSGDVGSLVDDTRQTRYRPPFSTPLRNPSRRPPTLCMVIRFRWQRRRDIANACRLRSTTTRIRGSKFAGEHSTLY